MSEFKFYDVEQDLDGEWGQLRAGRLTSSKLGCVMANYGKAFGDPAKKYAVNIAVEQITGIPTPSSFSNDHMLRGHEQEPIARALYEERTFSTVTNGGFFGSDFVGCSPDGLVLKPGVVEIKSVISSTHFATIKRGGFDPAYRWQCIGNLKFTGRDWIDFVSYCADFPDDKQLYVYRGHKEDFPEQFAMIDDRISQFKELVKATKETILNSEYFINQI